MLEDRHEEYITKEMYEVIDKVCEEKNIKTNQFLDFFCGYLSGNISQIVEKCIQYNEADGWHEWTKDGKRMVVV